jgi:MoaA/NifB/PqqE/SkfB family radical SAM enzyme
MSRAEKQLKKIPQYTRLQRHLWALRRHGTPRKWANLMRVEWERKLKRVRLKGHPYLLIIDPCNVCNLRCPLCPTGLRELGRPQRLLSFAQFKRYFDPFIPYLFEVTLHNWGEPLLNPEVFHMIAYAQRHNVGTNLSSNFVAVTSEDLDNLLDSGLEYLVISLDGTTEEAYEHYRIQGDFHRVMANLREFIHRRNLRRQRGPLVEWQYIVMKQNEHQIPEAEELAKKLGVDILRFIPVGIPFESRNYQALAAQWYPTTLAGRVKSNHPQQQFGQGTRPGPCYYLYRTMVINPDGGVSPCCLVYLRERDFATLDQSDFEIMAVWNNVHYRSAREFFAGSLNSQGPRTVCEQCTLFSKLL